VGAGHASPLGRELVEDYGDLSDGFSPRPVWLSARHAKWISPEKNIPHGQHCAAVRELASPDRGSFPESVHNTAGR